MKVLFFILLLLFIFWIYLIKSSLTSYNPIYFYIYRSCDREYIRTSLILDILGIIIYVFVAILASALFNLIHFFENLFLYLVITTLIFKLFKLYQMYLKSQVELISELEILIFKYEQYQIMGMHPIKSLNYASENLSFIRAQDSMRGYIREFDEIFMFTKISIVRKISMLIKRNQTFTSKELDDVFYDISQDIHQKIKAIKKVELEKRENAMLVPMVVNMIFMIVYLISPFLVVFFKGGMK